MPRFRDEWATVVASDSWFAGRGYRLLLRDGPKGMDQGVHLYEGDRLAIRFAADRSQWFVEVRLLEDSYIGEGEEGWFDLEIWSVCLGQSASFHASEGSDAHVLAQSWHLEPQLDYLVRNLAELEALAESDRRISTADCLRRARGVRAAELWG